MFNRDFYPTPKEVIQRMTAGSDIYGKVVLEPSAGKGDIVDYLNEYGAKEVLACEVNHDLAKIIARKCRILAADFLTVRAEDVSHVDFIVMNPPFSADEDHILHAWEIAPEGCTIISLCNSSTIHELHYSKNMRINELLGLYGKSEEFGDCFSIAERTTGINVSCIWLYKPRTGTDEFADYFDVSEEEESNTQAGIIQYNYVRDVVGRYVEAIHLYDKIAPLANEINGLTAPFAKYGIKFGAYRVGDSGHGNEYITRDTYKKELQKQAWKHLFEKMNMKKYVTSQVNATINRFV
jgi:hypothetical protein